MATTTPDTSVPSATGSRWKRVAIVAAVVAAALGAGVLLFGKSVMWHTWANSAQEKDNRAAIVAEQDPGIVDVLVSTMRDPDKSDRARIACGEILVREKNRIADVEKALVDPDIDVRRIALKVLSRESYFQRQYVAEPAYRVEPTMVEWITSPHARRREDALSLATMVWPLPKPNEPSKVPPAVLDAIVHVLEDPATASEPGFRSAAARVPRVYAACAYLPRLLAAAKAEQDPQARREETDAIVHLAGGPCEKDISDADLRALVEANFALAVAGGRGDDHDRALRMRTMSILGQHPDWAGPHVPAIRNVLASSDNPAERRTAFETLIALKDPPTLEEFARWFHDPYAGIRSAAAEAVAEGLGGLVTDDHLSTLVGFVRDESVRLAVETGRLKATLTRLRRRAGSWIGVPESLKTSGPLIAKDLQQFFDPLLIQRQSQGVTRDAFADAWWRWMAGQYGVAEEDMAKAVAARDAFWKAAKASDVAGAKAALEGVPVKDPRVFEYERGWLASHGK